MAFTQDELKSGSLEAADDVVELASPSINTVLVQLTGTFSATAVFEVNVDQGSSPTWVATFAQNVNTGLLVSSATATGIFRVDVSGAREFRVRCSAYTSGTVVVTLNGSIATPAHFGSASGMLVDTELPAALALANNTAQQTAPFVGAQLFGAGTSNEHFSLIVAQALSDGSTGGRSLPAFGWIFNNTSWDRERMAFEATLLASAERDTGAVETSADIRTYNLRGISVVLDVTAIADTPSLVVTINGKDSTSGKYYNLLTSAAVVGVSTNVYTVYPGQNTAAGLQVNRPVPPIVQVVVTPADSDSATYSLNYALHQ